jgi:uncharacterized repeat protein (TIGR03803 family)
MTKLNWITKACSLFLLWAATAVALPAQTFTSLLSFAGADGSAPYAGLVQGADGNFYGTTDGGGANFDGTIFKVTPTGTLTTLHNFDGTDGTHPLAALVLATNGNFYGTTAGGGAYDGGTIFEITASGTLTTLHIFAGPEGGIPEAALIQATNGNFYGTAAGGGGSSACGFGIGCGTVFEITPSGTLTLLHRFTMIDGGLPFAALIQATNGNFYGTTFLGGAGTACNGGCGTIFEITPGGAFETLHSFDVTDGSYTEAALVQASNGNFYGATHAGGANDYGTIFEITPEGMLTTLHSFNGSDGFEPDAALVQATDGNFYGASGGGPTDYGTIFEITPRGTLTTLHIFEGPDGAGPNGLVQAASGSFYGTTSSGGGAMEDGTIFNLAVGLGPFVETVPTSGRVGAHVKILGSNLTGATSVTFNGTAATFTVVSHALITTTVPTGATTGKVQVTVPSGTLSSNVPFTVK